MAKTIGNSWIEVLSHDKGDLIPQPQCGVVLTVDQGAGGDVHHHGSDAGRQLSFPLGCTSAVEPDQIQTDLVEFLGELRFVSVRIRRHHGPSSRSILFSMVQGTHLAVVLTTVIGRIVSQQAVKRGLRPFEP